MTKEQVERNKAVESFHQIARRRDLFKFIHGNTRKLFNPMKHNTHSELMRGHKVLVYQDPLTQNKPEGQATLSTYIKTEGELEYWNVRFDGEKEIYPRWIRSYSQACRLALSDIRRLYCGQPEENYSDIRSTVASVEAGKQGGKQ